MPVGIEYNEEQISIGNTVPGNSLSFTKWNGIYVAVKCACVNASWEDLDKYGLIFGQLVKIDGAFYLCRSLKVGIADEVPNEWDALLDVMGDDDSLWHLKKQYFWGQETPPRYASRRAVRGHDSSRYWYHLTASLQLSYVGFRPVLEPLPSEPMVSDDLIGHSIKVYVDEVSVTGLLVNYSDYDLAVRTERPLPKNSSWFRQIKDIVYIDREAVTYMRNV